MDPELEAVIQRAEAEARTQSANLIARFALAPAAHLLTNVAIGGAPPLSLDAGAEMDVHDRTQQAAGLLGLPVEPRTQV